MRAILFRLFVTSAAVLLVARFMPGIEVEGPLDLILAASLLGFFNAFVRPVMIFLTLPATIITFGLFVFIINGLLLYLVSYLVAGFHIESFGIAVLASILISIVSGIINWLARYD